LYFCNFGPSLAKVGPPLEKNPGSTYETTCHLSSTYALLAGVLNMGVMVTKMFNG